MNNINFNNLLDGVTLITSQQFGDCRGWFMETYNEKLYAQHGINVKFVQDNMSFSKNRGTVRGMHWQSGKHAQAKLVYVISGSVVDVAVDVRKDSKTYGQYVSAVLSAQNHRQLFIPRGFAHGFMTLTDDVVFVYKCDNFYCKESERGFRYDDQAININWPILDVAPTLSEKDLLYPSFVNIEPWSFD